MVGSPRDRRPEEKRQIKIGEKYCHAVADQSLGKITEDHEGYRRTPRQA